MLHLWAEKEEELLSLNAVFSGLRVSLFGEAAKEYRVGCSFRLSKDLNPCS